MSNHVIIALVCLIVVLIITFGKEEKTEFCCVSSKLYLVSHVQSPIYNLFWCFYDLERRKEKEEEKEKNKYPQSNKIIIMRPN